jgi:hypothetical protein
MSGVQAGLAADADIIVGMDADGQFAAADLRAAPVLIAAIRDYSPLKFFGSLALLMFVPSWLIGCGVLLGVLLAAVAILADLIPRLKFQVEEVLHDSRRLRGRS